MDAIAASDDGLCLSQKLSQVSLHPPPPPHRMPLDHILSTLAEDDLDGICSQDFFCTPDFLTPIEQQFQVDLEGNKENVASIHSPLKCSPVRSKRPRPTDTMFMRQPTISLKDNLLLSQLENATRLEEPNDPPPAELQSQTRIYSRMDYLPPNSRARIANMRRRALSPPCVRNPFRACDDDCSAFIEKVPPKQAQFLPPVGATCGSRYREEFHEIKEIGRGNFSSVFKVIKRIDGCSYAVKRLHRQLRIDSERRQALTEVQAMAAVGLHENIVRYHTAWFESDHLYIQMELCDGNLCSASKVGSRERFLVEVLRQISRALAFIHASGLAHLDVKPDNIYYAGNIFKLGDFGRATRLDGSTIVEEGDSRYMPLELINDNYQHLTKADIFALGATVYELARDFPLPSSGAQFQALRQGKLPLLPGFSLPFQNLLKMLMHANPELRPSAQDLLKHALFRSS